MTATFDHEHLRFSYPENWTLTQEIGSEHPWDITVESPTGSFWSIHVFELNASTEAMIQSIQEAFTDQYEDVEFSPATDVNPGFDADFYCLDFLVSAQVRIHRTTEYSIVNCWQAESRELEELRPVFAAITASLLGKLGNPVIPNRFGHVNSTIRAILVPHL